MSPNSVHSEAEYLSIVKHFISIGHVHSFSTCDRIVAQGSFDRLAHAEEEPKGGVVCTLSDEDGDTFTFVENKHAKIYKTITLRHKDLEKSLVQIEKVLAKITHDSHVRIRAAKDHPVYVAFEDLKLKYPMYHFTKSNMEDEQESSSILQATLDLDKNYTSVAIGKDNIVELLMTEIRSKYTLGDKQLALLQGVLKENNV